ncbi:MAG TPA: DUF3343 domain-containing protein [Clostridiaceae bacterium]|nr:DUF3343 domain-containing protein [Clostridiaceae bacterium]
MCNKAKYPYVATFFTHLGAIEFYEVLKKLGDKTAKMSPVPRHISISCGTGVFFSREYTPDEMSNPDVEKVFRIVGDKYIEIWGNEDIW